MGRVRSWRAFGTGLGLVLVVGGVALAATGGFVGSDGTIQVCIAERDFVDPVSDLVDPVTGIAVKTVLVRAGTMRAVRPGESCKAAESAVTINQTGPPGAAATASEDVPWSYEGETGPANWGALSPAYARCATGKRQSPINLRDPDNASYPAIKTNYQSSALTEADNGHTVEVSSDLPQRLVLGTKRYELAQFHFHVKSEHTINGARSPMEIHFVHKAQDGSIAVVGVLVKTGAANTAFGRLLAALPKSEGEELSPEGTINPVRLMPSSRRAWRYSGSLTTPPCTQGLRWLVLADSITVSKAQLEKMKAVLHDNFRPLQPRNGRQVTLR